MHGTRSIVESNQTTLPIEAVGREIKVRIEAGDKAMDKAEQHYIAAGIQLAEAKKRLRETGEMRWSAFLFSHARIQRRRADELIAIADGRTTLAELREQNRERVAAHRERKKSEPALRNAEPTAPVSSAPEDLRAIIDRQISEIADLIAKNKRLRERLKEQAGIIKARDNMVDIAEGQSQKAYTRAMFAEADKERLEKEVARLMDLLEIRTAPTPDNDSGLAQALPSLSAA